MPWLNTVDASWLSETIAGHRGIYFLEDHSPRGGLGEFLISQISQSNASQKYCFNIFGVEGYLGCGSREEVLRHHQLDVASLVKRIELSLKK